MPRWTKWQRPCPISRSRWDSGTGWCCDSRLRRGRGMARGAVRPLAMRDRPAACRVCAAAPSAVSPGWQHGMPKRSCVASTRAAVTRSAILPSILCIRQLYWMAGSDSIWQARCICWHAREMTWHAGLVKSDSPCARNCDAAADCWPCTRQGTHR